MTDRYASKLYKSIYDWYYIVIQIWYL
jgi:hypothetical protein